MNRFLIYLLLSSLFLVTNALASNTNNNNIRGSYDGYYTRNPTYNRRETQNRYQAWLDRSRTWSRVPYVRLYRPYRRYYFYSRWYR